ncbi:MAG: CxxxxCH/CxxCH domain c-type cytochrome, partial [Myxococcota bacterium]
MSTHLDGELQVSAAGCNACHGNEDNAAPPVELAGNSDPSLLGVGAHQTHLSGGQFSRPVECSECHVVPASVDAPGHTDGDGVAEVVFSGVAVADGMSPAWDRSTETCGATYCHGTEALGGSLTEPVWTEVDAMQAACGSCHGLPPPPPHTANPDCELCHVETADPGLTIAQPQLHVDGTVDIAGGPCNQCHGGEDSAAPPPDLAGNTGTDAPGVGAHRSHLDAEQMNLAQPFACDVCHPLPPISGVHLDGSTDMVFTGIATGTVPGAAVSHQSTPSYEP